MSSVSSSINKSNTKFISFLEEPVVKYTVLIIITLLIIFIEKIDTSVLEVFDLSIFKIIYALTGFIHQLLQLRNLPNAVK